jgi:hypothetical protein
MNTNTKAITVVTPRGALTTPKTPLVILADVSGSMRGRKYEELNRALERVLGDRSDATLYAFNSEVLFVPPDLPLPLPYAGTDLARAVKVAKKHNPERVLIITDGDPDSHSEALEAIDKLEWTRVDMLYIGASESARVFCAEMLRNGGRLISEASNMLPNITFLLGDGSPISL